MLAAACWVAAYLLVLAAPAAAQTITPGANLAQTGQPQPGGPVFVSFTNSFNPDLSTTVFQVTATSSDGSPLAYQWALSAQCGSITAPGSDQPSNGYFHGPTSDNPNGCPPPPGIEINTTVTVTVFRSADKAAGGGPKAGAPAFTYTMVARAGDEADTAGYPANAQLVYTAPLPTPTAAPSSIPSGAATAPAVVQTATTTEGPPWWIWVGLPIVLLTIAVIAIVTLLRPRLLQTVEKPPEERCAREKAALAAAAAADKAAHAKYDPLKAAADRLSSAQRTQGQAQEDWDKWQKASGASQVTDSATIGDTTVSKTRWVYRYPSTQKQAEAARAALDAAKRRSPMPRRPSTRWAAGTPITRRRRTSTRPTPT